MKLYLRPNNMLTMVKKKEFFSKCIKDKSKETIKWNIVFAIRQFVTNKFLHICIELQRNSQINYLENIKILNRTIQEQKKIINVLKENNTK